jgi:hypothetical protein
MKDLFRLLFIATIAMTSCNSQTEKTESAESKSSQSDPKEEFAKLNQFLRKFDEPLQTFRGGSKLIKVTGKNGTIIHINPADLEMENGERVGKDIDIELKELSTREQFLRANTQTISDGQLLVSGGAYFINVTSNGKKVKLKEGKSYSVQFPKLSDDEMTLYYGNRDSSDKMNWKQTDERFIISMPTRDSPKEYDAVIVTGQGRFSDTITVAMKNLSKEEYKKFKKETEIYSKVYNPVEINKFGWINCDRLFKTDVPRTNIQFVITNKLEDENYVNVYLIFKEIKSVMQASYFIHKDTIEGNGFDNLPVGMTVRFLAISYQNEKIFATLTDTMPIRKNQYENLTLQEFNETDFDKLMSSVE